MTEPPLPRAATGGLPGADHATGGRPGNLNRLIPATMIVSLPFTYAGTLSVGFPLKTYELLFVVWVALLVVKAGSSRRFRLSRRLTWLAVPAAAYWLWCLASTIWGTSLLAETSVLIDVESWRHQPGIASVMKSLYVGFSLLVLFLIILDPIVTPARIVRWWCLGSVLACVYAWYLWGGSLLRLPVPTLPGQSELQRITDGPLVGAVRSGAFLEGNFAGAYYVLSISVAGIGFILTRRRWYLGVSLLATATLFTAWSTIAFSVFAFVAFGILLRLAIPTMLRHPLQALGVLGALVVLAVVGMQLRVVEEVVLVKLSDTSAGSSRAMRYDQFRSAIAMCRDRPLTGVGIANYGFHYANYTAYSLANSERELALLHAIANNVYAEIASELGTVGLILFAWILARIAVVAWHAPRGALRTLVMLGFFSVLLIWNAFPTSTMTFQWIFFALAWKIGSLGNVGENSLQPARSAHYPTSVTLDLGSR